MSRLLIIATLLVLQVTCRRQLPVFELKLDGTVEERYSKVVAHYKDEFTKVWNHLNELLDGDLQEAMVILSTLRGNEEDRLQEEIEYFANAMNISVEGIHVIQAFYEIGTLMVPIVNLTDYKSYDGINGFKDIIGEKYAKLLNIDHINFNKLTTHKKKSLLSIFEKKACCGIIGKGKDGTVYHARNFDLFPLLNEIQYIGNFTRDGKTVFIAGQIAGFSGVFTGFKAGNFAIEFNTRFPDHVGGNEDFIDNYLIKKAPLVCWEARKLLETETDYDTVVEKLSTMNITATAFIFISGVQKGTILAREPVGLEHKLTLGETDDDYIIVTNFDYWDHDIRAYFDYTAEFGHPRRLVAKGILDKAGEITEEVLWSAISGKGVLAHNVDVTLLQAVMNVEKNYFNASSPQDL